MHAIYMSIDETKHLPNKILTIVVPCTDELMAHTVNSLITLRKDFIQAGYYYDYTPHIQIFNNPSDSLKTNMTSNSKSIIATQWMRTADHHDLLLMINPDQTFTTADVLKCMKIIIEEGADVVCADYMTHAGTTLMVPANDYPKTRRIVHGPSGFIMIRRPILQRIHYHISNDVMSGDKSNKETSTNLVDIAPFFEGRIKGAVESAKDGAQYIDGDRAFCEFVHVVGGSLKGFMSMNIGHYVPSVKYLNRHITDATHHFIPAVGYLNSNLVKHS